MKREQQGKEKLPICIKLVRIYKVEIGSSTRQIHLQKQDGDLPRTRWSKNMLHLVYLWQHTSLWLSLS